MGEKRSIFLRIVFSILWFFPVSLVIQMFIGGIVGGFAGQDAHGFNDGYAAGQHASLAFFHEYGRIVFLGVIVLWLLMCFFGILPGTSEYKKAKKESV